MGRFRDFLRRARDRKLVQWALAYLAAAWALAEGFELVGSQFGWPIEIRRGITLLLGMGFLVTLVLAWYHGEKGRQRVSGPELIMLAVLCGVAGLLLVRIDGPAERGPDLEAARGARAAVAVLPFENISGDSIDRFFTDGVHEEIIARLSRLSGLDVIARTSVMPYRGSEKPVREIAQDLNVTALLEGSVRRSGNRVRIGAELVQRGGQVAWSGQWDRELDPDSIFEIQEEIASGVAAALDARLTRSEESRVAVHPTHDLEAYDYYLLGRHRWATRTRAGVREAIALFEAAIERDPTYAQAYAGLADAWAVRTWYDTVPPADTYPRARQAAQRALELDDGLAQAHATLGLVAHEYDWDWTRAEQRFGRAIELRPNYAAVHHWYAILLSNLGQHDAAIREGERALALDPLSAVIRGDVAGILWTAGRTSEALALLDSVVDRQSPTPPILALEQAIILLYESRWEAAAASLERWARMAGFEEPHRARTIARAAAGQVSGAEGLAVLAAIEGSPAAERVDLIPLYALLGDRRTALAGVETAHTERSPWVVWMGTLPWYDSLRAEPSFRDLLLQLGLPNGR